MALAYTPGLKVKALTTVKVTRRLPIPGDVLVKEGDKVLFDTIVARTSIPGDVLVENAASIIGIDPMGGEEIEKYLIKKPGQTVEKDEIIAKRVELFGLIKAFYKSPVKGSVEYFSNATGSVAVRTAPLPVEINAYVSGTVSQIYPREGVVIEAQASFIQGIFGIGGRTHGQIKVAVSSPTEALEASKISADDKGKILIGGSMVTSDALKKAAEVGAKGVVAGGIAINDLRNFMGFDIGVAITGEEDVGLTMIITEGFGKMNMASRTFELLKSMNGKEAAINGETQIRAGVLRPEIIIPLAEPPKQGEQEEEAFKKGMTSGMRVRLIRDPYFGALGAITGLPVELERIETESDVRIMEVTLDDGRKVTVPRANVEIIEE